MITKSKLVDERGNPLSVGATPRSGLADVRAQYDAARTTAEYRNIWLNADFLDADSANSKIVRHTLMSRMRYERGSDGYLDGILQTHVDYLIGTGPMLRVETANTTFNESVEDRYNSWKRAIKLDKKLWTLAHAKITDGEGFAIVRNNPRVRDRIKLDMQLVEAEQVQTPELPFDANYIDGIRVDDFGDPISYDVLVNHPGNNQQGFSSVNSETFSVPAEFMLHWFKQKRPGMHRAVPEFTSTLNLGAGSRRFREATIAAAETAADYTTFLETTLSPEVDPVQPMSELPIEKRMLTALPMGWSATQMKAEHPNASYKDFNRQHVNELARPKSMPVNVAMSDSSEHNFASGRLDSLPWFQGIKVERKDCRDVVLDPLFLLWWQEAALEYGYRVGFVPRHGWQWPELPQADERAKASAREFNLKNGSTSLTEVYAEDGQDFHGEALPRLSKDYNVEVEEMQAILRNKNLGLQTAITPEEVQDLDEDYEYRSDSSGDGDDPFSQNNPDDTVEE